MQIELEPCPFCGRAYARIRKSADFNHVFYVCCDCCGARTQYGYTEKEAAHWWNMRPENKKENNNVETIC